MLGDGLVHCVYVRDDFRHLGIGRALVGGLVTEPKLRCVSVPARSEMSSSDGKTDGGFPKYCNDPEALPRDGCNLFVIQEPPFYGDALVISVAADDGDRENMLFHKKRRRVKYGDTWVEWWEIEAPK